MTWDFFNFEFPRFLGCGYSIGRHSKSLDTKAKICGKCHGTFECRKNLDYASGGGTPRSRGGSASGFSSASSTPGGGSSAPVTPRTPNKFALFVKDSYASTKKENSDLKHGDIMKLLGKEFAEKMKVWPVNTNCAFCALSLNCHFLHSMKWICGWKEPFLLSFINELL